MEEFKGSAAIDAAIISAAQKVEHYEIASYGCLQEWAQLMGEDDAAARFEEILEQEKAADEKLTEIARQVANQEAESEESEEDEEQSSSRSTQSKSRNGGASSRAKQSKSSNGGGSSRRKTAARTSRR